MAAKKINSNKSVVGMGVAAGIAVAGIAAAYFLYGTKDGAKTRKSARSWMLRMKADVIDEINKLKDVNESSYRKVVDTAMAKYKKLKHVDMSELKNVGAEMMDHWKNIKSEFNTGREEMAGAVKAVKKIKKAVKKTV